MRLANMSTKKSKEVRSSNIRFFFLKTINFAVIIVIRYQLKSLKYSLCPQKKPLRHVITQCSIANYVKTIGT